MITTMRLANHSLGLNDDNSLSKHDVANEILKPLPENLPKGKFHCVCNLCLFAPVRWVPTHALGTHDPYFTSFCLLSLIDWQ